jgi:hypothetical protein
MKNVFIVLACSTLLSGCTSLSFYANPLNFFSHPIERAIENIPEEHKQFPKVANEPMTAPDLRISIREDVVFNFLAGLVNQGLDFVIDESGKLVPRTAYARLESVGTVEFTEKGTIRLEAKGRVLVHSWIRGNIGIERLEVHYVPYPIASDETDEYVLILRPFITDLQLGVLPSNNDLRDKLQRLLLYSLNKEMYREQVGELSIKKNDLRLDIDLFKEAPVDLRVTELSTFTADGYLMLSGRLETVEAN